MPHKPAGNSALKVIILFIQQCLRLSLLTKTAKQLEITTTQEGGDVSGIRYKINAAASTPSAGPYDIKGCKETYCSKEAKIQFRDVSEMELLLCSLLELQ